MNIETQDLILKKIGDKVRKLRKSNPNYYNYEVFAFKNNLNKVTVLRIERGENYNIKSLLLVLKSLDVKLSDFFSDID